MNGGASGDLWTLSRGVKVPATLCLEGRDIALGRLWAAVVWPGQGPGYLLAAGQDDQGQHVYLLHESAQPDWPELTRKLAQARAALGLGLVLHEGGAAGNAFADRANRLASDEGLTPLEAWGERQTLGFSQAPWLEHGRFLVGLLRDAVASQRLTLMPGLDLLLGQMRQAQSLAPAQVVERLEELFALKALSMLLGAFDCWRQAKPGAGQKLELEPMDDRVGF